MKKSLTTIFSLGLLLSVANPVFGACSTDKKEPTWKKEPTRDTICCDKDSTRRAMNAGIIAGLAFAADPIVKAILDIEHLKSSAEWVAGLPGLTNDRLVKGFAVLIAAVGGSWIIKNNLAKKIINLF